MLILTAINVTTGGTTRDGGLSDYEVYLGVGPHCIWKGALAGHIRDAGAPALLRLIADKVEIAKEMELTMPVLHRLVKEFGPVDPSEELLDKCRIDLLRALDKGIHCQKGRSMAASVERKIKRIVRERVKQNAKR